MKRTLTQPLAIFFLLVGNGIPLCSAQATEPVLYFSDITSGPKQGNSDASPGRVAGLDGAIVTIWGVNIGATQGDSKVVCNGADAASYYYWGNATAPSNMYAFHKMQAISFQVSHLARDGAGEIFVTVNGRRSNSLSSTVRSGNIYFVKTSGDDNTGSGSWTQPWKSIAKAVATIAVGDVAYVGDGADATTESDFSAAVNLGSSGTADNPKALVVYPGATVRVGNPDLERAIHIWNQDIGGYSEYWVLSKFTITTLAVGVFANTGFRVVGNRFTAPKANAGLEGCLYAIGSDVYLMGNELHNVGSFTSDDKMPHVLYVTGARRDDPPRTATEQNREIAWNYLHDNGINRGVQIYSEQANSAYIQRNRVHDNVIVNQRGDGILMGYYVTGENWIYNNLIVNAGLGPEWTETSYHTGIHLDTGHENVASTDIYCYNNTLYGCGFSGAALPGETGHILITAEALQRSNIHFSNNIIYSTGEPYIAGESSTLTAGDHRNCWFGKGTGPGWDTGAINADPKFASTSAKDFQLQSTSPCIDAGIDVLSVVARDLLGVKRIKGAIDLGPYEYVRQAIIRRDDILGTWNGQGVYTRNSDSGAWNYIASAAAQVATGDLDGDGTEDIVGLWQGSGVWVRFFSAGAWVNLASAADWIAAGDLNGDGRADLLGIWSGTIWSRDSATGTWSAISSGATRVAAGDLDGDGKADLIGVWPLSGTWVRYAATGQWANLASPADWIAAGDFTGDGKPDLLGIWNRQIYLRDSATGAWTLLASGASQAIGGDVDGDGKIDLIGTWGNSGVWVKYSSSGTWQLVSSPADWIAAGRLRPAGASGRPVP